jgi:hypothetical protein
MSSGGGHIINAEKKDKNRDRCVSFIKTNGASIAPYAGQGL